MNNFIVRQNNQVEPASNTDALKIIDFILSLNDSIKIDPDSLLYSVAVEQYNQVIKNTLERPPVPDWFCGKVEADTGELLLNLNDTELRSINGFNTLSAETTAPVVYISGGYAIDKQLKYGTPGSPGYVMQTSAIEGFNWASALVGNPIPVIEFDTIYTTSSSTDTVDDIEALTNTLITGNIS
jgi:hypothetical protein